MDTVLSNDDGSIINFGAPSATDEILAFHYGDFDDAYEDGTVGTAAANGRVYANTDPGELPTKFGSIGTPTTASGQTTYTWTPPATSLQANVLLVAGGGGGGNNKAGTYENGGGGGAGGVVYKTGETISGQQTIVVGQGGIIPAGNGQNTGKNTTAFGYTALGGGGGSTRDSQTNINGGSGGGAVNWYPHTTNGQATQPGSASGGYGNDGGTATQVASTDGGSAGGGGASQAGFNGSGTTGADGGAGFLASVFGEIYGESGWFAGGGAGGGGVGGLGGIGGGGAAGSSSSVNGTNGDAHTGGGGGGNFAPDGNAGNGGSGIVAIRYIVDTTVISHEEIGAFDILGSSVSSASLGTYSLRRIFGSYTGAQVRVRRSTDNTETYIYFDKYGSMINFNLTTWLGGGTAYVKTWYDQSGNGNDITQTDTASQPILTAPSGERAYIRFQSKIMTGPNVFGSSSVTDSHVIFASRENSRSSNFFINLNGNNQGNPGRFSFHSPWADGVWYYDPGNADTDRAQSGSNATAEGAKTVFSGYKSSADGKNGFRLNGDVRFLSSGITSADVTGGIRIGEGATDHSIYDLIIFSSKLSAANESYIEWNVS